MSTDDRHEHEAISDQGDDRAEEPREAPAIEEPRAGQVVRAQVPDRDLDPATVAQLAAWFGAPATSLDPDAAPELPGSSSPHGNDDAEDQWLVAKKKRLARADAATDPALRARLEAMRTAGDAFIRLPEPMSLPIERGLALADVDAWSMIVVETHDWERPDEIVDGLRVTTPQAILRDLHRPVLDWPMLFLQQDLGMDIGGLESTARIRETMSVSQQVRMEDLAMASVAGRRALDELQDRLDEPWDEIEIPEERRTGGQAVRTPEDFMWFGSVGYDPTV